MPSSSFIPPARPDRLRVPWPTLFLFAGAAMAASPRPPDSAAAAMDTALYRLQTFSPREGDRSRPLDAAPRKGSTEAALKAYTQVRSSAFAGWAPRGIHVLARLGIHPQLYRMDAPLGERRPETAFTRRVDQWAVNPDPGRLQALIALDQGGDEEFSLRLLDLSDGSTRGLACPPGRISAMKWNDSGTAFLYSHTPPGTDRWDIRLGRPGRPGHPGGPTAPPRPGEPARDALLLRREGTWTPMDWSPDGSRAVLQRYVSASESELWMLPLEGNDAGRPVRLFPEAPPQYYDHAVWVRIPGHSDPALVFTSDRAGDHHRLWLLRPGDAAPAPLSPPQPWDVEWVATGGDRRTVVYSVNEQGLSALHALRPKRAGDGNGRVPGDSGRAQDAPFGPPGRLRGIPEGIIEGAVFDPTGRKFGFTVNAAAFPGEAFTYDLDKGRARRWTRSPTGGLPRDRFREPELVHFPTFDSVAVPAGGKAGAGAVRVPRRIPAWLYLPAPRSAMDNPFLAPRSPPKSFPGRAGRRDPDEGPFATGLPPERFPVLVSIHGGPELQARAGFDPFVQYLVDRLRVAVILPNVRGSTGYGKAYQRADDGPLRMGAVRDIGALLDWVAERPELDSRRVAVSGRSYGGFMALASLIEYGDRLRCGISTVGITHFPSFLRETSEYRRDLRRAEYGDERDPAMESFLDSISPASRLDRLRRPLLLAHGRNDPRVPYAESVRLFEALKAQEVPVWLLTFNREGHAFRSEASQLVHYRVMAEFLSREFRLGKP